MTRTFQYSESQEAWLRDLETTTEPQTRGKLHRLKEYLGIPAGRCCLGVACATLGLAEEENSGGDWFSIMGSVNNAPQEVVDRLRLRDDEGNHASGDGKRALVCLNDDGKSFAEIAAIIRSDPWGYFERDAIGTEDQEPTP